jgi:hypothetical protein
MTYTTAVCTLRKSWWWMKELSETCRVSLQNNIWENWWIWLVLLWRFISMHGRMNVSMHGRMKVKLISTNLLHCIIYMLVSSLTCFCLT